MIFSTNFCPLCKQLLSVTKTELTDNKFIYSYSCKTLELIKNKSASSISSAHHYTNDVFAYKANTQVCNMIIPPFDLYHYKRENITRIYKLDFPWQHDKELIFKSAMLDIDYSDADIVAKRIKSLLIFI